MCYVLDIQLNLVNGESSLHIFHHLRVDNLSFPWPNICESPGNRVADPDPTPLKNGSGSDIKKMLIFHLFGTS